MSEYMSQKGFSDPWLNVEVLDRLSSENKSEEKNTIDRSSGKHAGHHQICFELTEEAKKDLALGKADYSKQCVDVASDVLYVIVSKKRLEQIHEILNKNKNSDYGGDGGFPELLALPSNDGKHEGIPMVVTLDDETTCDMICRAIDSITRPLIKNLAQHGEKIIIKCDYSDEDRMLIIGIFWEKKNENERKQ